MYACSPRWRADWIGRDDAQKVLSQLSKAFRKTYPPGFNRVGVNLGLHFTGGEPFLNFNLLLDLVNEAARLNMPSTFVETNCFWSIEDETTRTKLNQLKDAGLHGILISVNPFILEHVPFERTERAIRIGKQVFGPNVMVYQEFFRHQLERLDIRDTLPLEAYLQKAGARSLHYAELIPMGRACYELGHLFKKHSASHFLSESCKEELTRPWHIHIDNYCNYITGYCGGISLGDARDLDSICAGIDLEDYPVIARLVSPRGIEELHRFSVEEFGYRELREGYVSKCHMCVDIRKHISEQTDEFKELRPVEFYRSL
jgi:MoaA/NifB/PqqE/SkfB family radical SAM enzyme